MQQIVIESVGTKEGKSEKGKWVLVIIKTADGSEFTSFDTKLAGLQQGTILDIEPEVKNGKTNIKEFVIKSQPAQTAPAVASQAGPAMTNEDWKEKQRIERESIEEQTAVKAVLGLAELALGVGNQNSEVFKRIWSSTEKALNWCDKRLATAVVENKAPHNASTARNTEGQPNPSPEKGEPIKNVGDLFTRALALGINRTQVLGILGVKSQQDINVTGDLEMAWELIRKHGSAEKAT